MAEAVYNWSKMCDKASGIQDNAKMTDVDAARLKNLYRSIWIGVLGDDKGFDAFFAECKKGKVTLFIPEVDNDKKPILDESGKPTYRMKDGKLEQETVDVSGDIFMRKLRQEYELRKGEVFDRNAFKRGIDNVLNPEKGHIPVIVDANGKPTTAFGGPLEKGEAPVVDFELARALRMIETQYSHVGISNSDTHMAAGFLTGLGYHLQQGCGQGKSSAVATAALMQRGFNAKADKQVFITSSTPELAAQSFGDVAAYFDDLGIGAQDAQGTQQERVFLMTEDGPKVAVRCANGKMLTANDIGEENFKGFNGEYKYSRVDDFGETASCETEDVKFVVKPDGSVEIAKRNVVIEGKPKTIEVVVGKNEDGSDKVKSTTVKRDRLGWEPGAKTYAELAELGPEVQRKALAAIYGNKDNIIISDNATIVQDNMRGAIPPMEHGERHALMDEGDYVKNDQYHYLQQKGEAYENQAERNDLRQKARAVMLEIIQDKANFECDFQTQYADFTDAGMIAIMAAWESKYPDIELTNEIMEFVEEALVVETVFKEGIDYAIEGGRVVSQAKASGTAIDLPEGIAQALAIKENKTPPTEYRVYNIQTIVGAYDKIFGKDGQTRLSGTHERDTLENAKSVVVANRELPGQPSDKVAEKREAAAALEAQENSGSKQAYAEAVNEAFQNTRYRTMLGSRSEVDAAIIAEAEAILDCGRPVLIGCVSSNDIDEMKRGFRGEDKEPPKDPADRIVEIFGEKEKAIRVITYTAETSEQYRHDRNGLSEKEFKAVYGVSKKDYQKSKVQPVSEYDRVGLPDTEFSTRYGVEKSKAKKSFDAFVKGCGQERTLILGTSIVGRGANIAFNKKDKDIPTKGPNINKRGGLHVITRGIHPSSVRQMIQFINRSKRGADNGSSHEFFSPEDLAAAEPQIEARRVELNAQIVALEGKGKLTQEERKKLAKLKKEYDECETSLRVLKGMGSTFESQGKKKTFSEGSKGILEMLDDQEATFLVDNDGRTVGAGDAQKEAEVAYRTFYGLADDRNELLALKAHSIEEQVTASLSTLKSHIQQLDCPLQEKVQIAKDLVPEFIGRALQVQYRANGHTKSEITAQYAAQIDILRSMYMNKAMFLSAGNKEAEFSEIDYIASLDLDENQAKAARRIFKLSAKEKENMRKNHDSYAQGAAKGIVKTTVERISDADLQKAYAELSGEVESGGRTITKKELLDAIERGSVSYQAVIDALNKVKSATASGPELGAAQERNNS